MDASQQRAESAPQALEPASNNASIAAAMESQPSGDVADAAPGPLSPPTAPAPELEEEEDPLVIAQREQEEREKALAEAADIKAYDDPDMKVSRK